MTKRRCKICQSLLSRFNTEPLCAPCARDTDKGPLFPVWLWDSLPLRRALANLDLGAALAIIRSGPGLSQLDLANLIGWSQSAVARAEAGERDSLYDIRRLLHVVDALDIPREVLIPLVLGESGEQHNSSEEREDDDMDRRQFGAGLLSLAATASLSQLSIPPKVDTAQIRYLRSATDKLWVNDQNMGGGRLVLDGLRLYHRARRMLDEADYNEAVGQELMGATGELARCVAWLAYDADNQTLARDLYSQARLLADQSRDDNLAIHVLSSMSRQSAVHFARKEGLTGSAREAVRLSERAVELARHNPSPQLHSLLATREAIAHAATGDRRAFTTAIARSRRELERGHDDEVPISLRFMTHAEISVQEAKGRLYLGDAPTAVKLYQGSLDGPLSERNRVNYRAQLATALAASGDVDNALDEGMAVLTALEDGISSRRTLLTLQPLRAVAGRHKRGMDLCIHYDRSESSSA